MGQYVTCSTEMSHMSKNKLWTYLTHRQSYWTLNMPGVESFKWRKTRLKFSHVRRKHMIEYIIPKSLFCFYFSM